jgi:hypothetical protein
LEWAFPLIQARYPRAMLAPVRQLLGRATAASQIPPVRLVRTHDAFGFAIAERDPFEPEWTVRLRFVIDRDSPSEAALVRAALHDWAKTLGAVSVDESAAPAPETERPAAAKAPARNRAKARNTRARSRGSSARPLPEDERQARSS